MTRKLVFTVDLDRDVNTHVDGCIEARSIDRGQGDEPRFSSSEKGLSMILDLLDEIGIKGTFFVEGRTSEMFDCSGVSKHCIGFHGYDHEDLTSCGNPLVQMRKGYDAVKDNIGIPTCFRAPFMKIDSDVFSCLEKLGVKHDSSVYSEDGEPYAYGPVMEHPVPKMRCEDGKSMAAYLWPMHEGKRSPEEYVSMSEKYDYFVIATHTWHMVEKRETGLMDADEMETNKDNVRKVLTGIIDSGFKAQTIE